MKDQTKFTPMRKINLESNCFVDVVLFVVAD